MSIAVLKIPFDGEYIVQGNTIGKTLFTFTDENIDLTTASISLVVYNGNTRFINASVGNGITVIDSDNFEIDEVSATDNDYPVGTFEGDLDITDANGNKHTYMRVEYTILRQYL